MIEAHAASIAGSSGVNADAWYIASDRHVVAVADGASGAADKVAGSRLCIEAIAAEPHSESISGSEHLHRRILDANDRLIAKSRADGRLSFSTLTAAVVAPGRATVACAGDSPAFHVRGGRIARMAPPPRRYDEVVRRGFISEDQARRAVEALPGPMQSAFELFLPEVVPVYTIAEAQLQPGDVLVLCSDGVLDWVPPLELAERLRARPALGAFADAVIADIEARSRGRGRDDATLLALRA